MFKKASAFNGSKCAKRKENCNGIKSGVHSKPGESLQDIQRSQLVLKLFCERLKKAKDFYRETLELDISETPEGLELRTGDNTVFVYLKPNHTN